VANWVERQARHFLPACPEPPPPIASAKACVSPTAHIQSVQRPGALASYRTGNSRCKGWPATGNQLPVVALSPSTPKVAASIGGCWASCCGRLHPTRIQDRHWRDHINQCVRTAAAILRSPLQSGEEGRSPGNYGPCGCRNSPCRSPGCGVEEAVASLAATTLPCQTRHGLSASSGGNKNVQRQRQLLCHGRRS
jgi:hypothetical protein